MTTQRDQERTPGQKSLRPSIAEVLGIPFGMKRLRIGDWILAAQDDKLIVTQRSKPTRHVTLHFGESSGYFDIHLTRHRPSMAVPPDLRGSSGIVTTSGAPPATARATILGPC